MNLDWYKSLEWFKRTKKIKKVLFVCSGNTCRSPSAEYYFKKMTSWWGGLKSFSRGTDVGKILADLESRGIDIKELFAVDEVKKVIGDKDSKFLKNHVATQITSEDMVEADLILTMERKLRDLLRGIFSAQSYKIFTLKGFVERTDNNRTANLEIGNPFIPPLIAKKQGILKDQPRELIPRYDKPYYLYLKNYMKILLIIEKYVRKLIETLYLLKKEI